MKWLLSLILLLQVCQLSAQTEKNHEVLKPLEIGDKMPDISLGDVTNNNTGKSRFSDFNGRLLILDFWDTKCAPCMAAFPKMQKLQNEFGDKIQIFLVNFRETRQQIEQEFEAIKKNNPKFFIPDLPIIANNQKVNSLFSGKYGNNIAGRHVWIDGHGIVRAMTVEYSTYDQKIGDFLSGKQISFLNDPAGCPSFDKTNPYWHYLTKPGVADATTILNSSLFTKYNNNYAIMASGIATDVIDTIAVTIRDTYVNQDVPFLYYLLFLDAVKNDLERTICGGSHRSVYKDLSWIDYFKLELKDTIRYTDLFIPRGNIIDSVYAQSKYCYEQIRPLSMSVEDRKNAMLIDLNKYFGKLYGVTGSLQKMRIPCYVLVRTSLKDKLNATPKGDYFNEKFIDNGVAKRRIVTSSVQQAIREVVAGSSVEKMLCSYINDLPQFLLNETDFKKGPIEIILPDKSELNTIEDLRNALLLYDLDIIRAEREIDFVVIREHAINN